MNFDVLIIGGGLAGSEAALQLAQRGWRVELREMRPARMTPAHLSDRLAELVCSNSLKSESPGAAVHLLKEELRALGCHLLKTAECHRVPAGHALAVDRQGFSEQVTRLVADHPLVQVIRAEQTIMPAERPCILASGPLTSEALFADLQEKLGPQDLYFHDAVSPIVTGDSLDRDIVFAASRYDRGGADDYLNCPMDREEYQRFHAALVSAEQHPLHEFESPHFFEGCLPVEELARRGPDTLRFGPLKPVGLTDPRTGRRPWAAVQLRRETAMADAFNLVGFQTNLKYGEQERVFRLTPGLASARFVRLGRMHRNSYLNAPRLLTPWQELKALPGSFVAGQLSGLEGYVEAIASGLTAALQVDRRLRGEAPLLFPRGSALGSLFHYMSNADPDRYQPANITFSLLPAPDPGEKKRKQGKAARNEQRVREALAEFRRFMEEGRLAPQD